MRLLHKNKHETPVTNVLSYGLLLGILATTLLSMAASKGWNIYLELASHFKLQYLGISLLLFVLLAIARKKYFLLIGLACIVINMVEIVPWYIPQPGVVNETTGNLRILLSNVNTQNQSYSKVISLVRQERPDIAVFIEIDEAWVEQLESINDIFPYQVGRSNPYNLGIGVYSKRPLEKPSLKFFGTENNPTILGDLIINNQVVSLVATHPLPPVKAEFFQSRNQQLNKISQYVQKLRKPVIVVGDLNITMWSPYYKNFVQETGLRNVRQGFGILPTWPTKSTFSPIPFPLSLLFSIPIDHFLISPQIKVANIRTGRNVGSDHLPMLADLFIPDKK